MVSFARKIKRKQKFKFYKDFKKTMNSYKKRVKCSDCTRRPVKGENIDNWSIKQDGDDINLVCVDCSSNKEKEIL